MRPQVTQNSRKAFKSQQANIETMHGKIMRVMHRLKFATKTEIAKALNVEQEKVHKRLAELTKKNELVKTEYSRRSPVTKELQAIWSLPNLKLKISA